MQTAETDSITVAVLTRRRPQMLKALVESFAALSIPEGCTARFLVVENDSEPRTQDVVETFGDRLPGGALDYVLETEPGIPFGRNRAAREAISSGHDLLAFVDDDEYVDVDWLTRLIEGYRTSRAKLIGAPLRIAPAPPGLTWFQERMHRCIARRYAKKERRAARRAGLDGTPGVTIVTNNWLGETALFSENGIWFDEEMRMTGGTDSKFYHEVVTAGHPTAWVEDAFVYETVPPERLSFGYQYARGRDQSNNNFRRKIAQNGWARATVLVSLPVKAVSAAVLAILVLPSNGATLLDLARTLGWMAGRVSALLDIRSTHYQETTGS